MERAGAQTPRSVNTRSQRAHGSGHESDGNHSLCMMSKIVILLRKKYNRANTLVGYKYADDVKRNDDVRLAMLYRRYPYNPMLDSRI